MLIPQTAPNSPCLNDSKPGVTARARNKRLKRKYGLMQNEWEVLFAQQGNKCACCESDKIAEGLGWHTDHDHKTGRLRGILCGHCNLMVGLAGDSTENLLKGAEYLERSKC